MLQRFSHGDARLVADLRTTSVQREGLESSIMLQRFGHGDARPVADLRTTSVQRELEWCTAAAAAALRSARSDSGSMTLACLRGRFAR